jgi:hypothetical protein
MRCGCSSTSTDSEASSHASASTACRQHIELAAIGQRRHDPPMKLLATMLLRSVFATAG